MKLLGAGLLLACGALWGLGEREKLSRRLGLLLALEQLVDRISAGLRGTGMSLGEMLLAGKESGCPFCSLALAAGSDSPRQALSLAGKRLLHRKEDLQLLAALLDGLGECDWESQLQRLTLTAQRTREAIGAARRELGDRGRLAPAVSVLGAAALCVLLL